MSDPSHSTESHDDAAAAAELEKLRLEIDQLKVGRGWEQRAINFLPLIVVLISVFTVSVGIYQYRATNKREQDIRIQTQINADGQQLFRFVKDDRMAISAVAFSFQDLDELCDLLSQNDKDKGAAVRLKITLALHETVWDECDFSRVRDVQFNNTAMSFWTDYLEHLKSGSGNLPYLVGKYMDALRDVSGSSPEFFRDLHRDEKNKTWIKPTTIDKSKFALFEDLYLGIKQEIDALDAETRKTYVKQFQTTLCNSELTQTTFDLSFPDTAPDILAACPKAQPVQNVQSEQDKDAGGSKSPTP